MAIPKFETDPSVLHLMRFAAFAMAFSACWEALFQSLHQDVAIVSLPLGFIMRTEHGVHTFASFANKLFNQLQKMRKAE